MDPEIDFSAIFSEFDTLLMGRKTYAPMAGSKGKGGPFAAHKIVVVSRTLDPREHPGVTIVSSKLKETVTALKREKGKDIWLFGGGELFQGLLELGLVDGVDVAVMPALLGQGIPPLPAPAKQAKLKLTSHRIYGKTGIVSLRYDVKPSRRK